MFCVKFSSFRGICDLLFDFYFFVAFNYLYVMSFFSVVLWDWLARDNTVKANAFKPVSLVYHCLFVFWNHVTYFVFSYTQTHGPMLVFVPISQFVLSRVGQLLWESECSARLKFTTLCLYFSVCVYIESNEALFVYRYVHCCVLKTLIRMCVVNCVYFERKCFYFLFFLHFKQRR